MERAKEGVATRPTMITPERGRGLWSGADRNEVTILRLHFLLMNSIEIEKHIAFHSNDSNVFVRKWSRFKDNLSKNLLH